MSFVIVAIFDSWTVVSACEGGAGEITHRSCCRAIVFAILFDIAATILQFGGGLEEIGLLADSPAVCFKISSKQIRGNTSHS